jgi:sec-independent protein translocase protein TatB
MFDFDAGKLVVIGAVALIVIGPKELPRVLRQVGQLVAKMRRMATDFQSQFMDAMREADLADVKEEMSKIAETAKLDVAFDPVKDVRNQISKAIEGTPDPTLAATAAATLPGHDAAHDAGVELAGAPALPTPASALAEGGLVATGIAPGVPEQAEPVVTAAPVAMPLDYPPSVGEPVKDHSA